MASGRVWVLPGMFPATMKVAPNSPRARAVPSTHPARMPRLASGRVTRRNTASSPEPRVRAAFSSCGSTPAIAAWADCTIRGSPTMVAATTAAAGVNSRRRPSHSNSGLPRPSARSR